jgi:hypothetical protein
LAVPRSLKAQRWPLPDEVTLQFLGASSPSGNSRSLCSINISQTRPFVKKATDIAGSVVLEPDLADAARQAPRQPIHKAQPGRTPSGARTFTRLPKEPHSRHGADDPKPDHRLHTLQQGNSEAIQQVRGPQPVEPLAVEPVEQADAQQRVSSTARRRTSARASPRS